MNYRRPTCSPRVGRFLPARMIVLFLIVFMLFLSSAFGSQVDLTGWWKNLEDNGHMIKILQEGSDVTILGTDQPTISGSFSNDTLLVFFSPTDTLIFVYANDTLRGHSEEDKPITLVRYIVDLNGWWKNLGSVDFLKILQQGTNVKIWDMDSTILLDGFFANDTLLVFLAPLSLDTLTLVYDFDTLRGLDPDGNPIALIRAPYGPWTPIRCGTITVDGQTSDWSEAFLAADDPDDEAIDPSADLERLYFCHDSTYLYFRIDMAGDVFLPANWGNGGRYTIFLGTNGNDNDYGIFVWDAQGAIRFRNNLTGQETMLDPPGIFGHTIEGRVPLFLLDNFIKAEIRAGSEYYDDDNGWGFYDRVELLAERKSCLNERAVLTPIPQYAFYANSINPITDTVIIGDLRDHDLTDIDPASIRINGSIEPLITTIISGYPGFTGEVMQILISAAEFIEGYGLVWDSTFEEYLVTGQYADKGSFSIAGEVPFIGHKSGDANGDGKVNILDVTFMINYLYKLGPAPALLQAADVDHSGKINALDITYLVNFLYRHGPTPNCR